MSTANSLKILKLKPRLPALAHDNMPETECKELFSPMLSRLCVLSPVPSGIPNSERSGPGKMPNRAATALTCPVNSEKVSRYLGLVRRGLVAVCPIRWPLAADDSSSLELRGSRLAPLASISAACSYGSSREKT